MRGIDPPFWRMNLSRKPTAVDRQHDPVYVLRFRKAEERNGSGDIVCRRPAADRNATGDLRETALVLAQRRRQLRLDPPWRDRVDADPVRRPLVRLGLRQLRDAALAGGVRGGVDAGVERHHRGDVDDAAAVTLGNELTGCGAREDERTGEIDIEHAPPVVDRKLERGRAHHRAGVADRNVEPPERVDDGCDSVVAGARIAEIGLEDERPPSKSLNLARRPGSVGTLDEPDVGAEARPPPRDRATDAAAGSRAERDLAS